MPTSEIADCGLVLAFGSRRLIADGAQLAEIRRIYPQAPIVGCSTAGEIRGTRVANDSLVCTAIGFDDTRARTATADLDAPTDSLAAGRCLAESLADDDLRHVFVLADGMRTNGSELARGLNETLPDGVVVTGGLAGDGSRFAETLVLDGDEASPRRVAAVGLYGDRLEIGHGSLGGWDPFGPERLVTRSEENILRDLDGRSALALYKEYLGDQAADLPASGLLFPLEVRTADRGRLVRTILAVDEGEQSLVFAGDIPMNSYARLMMANLDRLIDGAIGAAQRSMARADASPTLAILVSCVGRKLVLQQRVEEEVEGVRDVLGGDTALCGFYSYGELSPLVATGVCGLHNQTMTITTLTEN